MSQAPPAASRLIEDAFLVEGTEVAVRAGVDPVRGLSDGEVADRRGQYGLNQLVAKPGEPMWRKLLRQFQDPLVYLLFLAMAISVGAWIVEGRQGAPIDALVIAFIVLANALIGLIQENKAANAVAALSEMTQAASTVLRDGRQVAVPSAELVPGDVLLLSEGDAVGADARLLEATALRVQEASLTGESEAVTKDPAVLEGKPSLGDRVNMVFKGTAVVSGVGRAVVTGTGMATEMGAIAHMLESTEVEMTPLKREITRVSKMLGMLVIGIAVVVMLALVIINGVSSAQDLVDILLVGVSLAVAAVPEGLPAILSLVLAVGVQLLARRNAVMKNLHSVETLGSASVICSDKTGTLTRNEMTLERILTASGETVLSGGGYNPAGEVESTTDDAARTEAQLVVLGGAVANNAQLNEGEEWSVTGDPTEGAFLVALPKFGDGAEPHLLRRTAEVPFSSERKRMSVVVEQEGGHVLYTKGAPDVLLRFCTAEYTADGPREITDERRDELATAVNRLSEQGYRTLGVATRQMGSPAADEADESELTFVGVVGIMDPPRDEVKDSIRQAHEAGIRTIMITGDHPVTALRIAQDLGITSQGGRSITGAELDELSEEEFQLATRDVDVYARVAPSHKLQIVDALQADGHVVAMTGDGINDAPALQSADMGVAMGITGTEVTKEAATMVLADDNYSTIVTAVRLGRAVYDNIRKFLRYLLSSNMGEVITVFGGVVLASFIGLVQPDGSIALPLLATQILWINLVTDSGPALAMGVDPAAPGIMRRKPRPSDMRIIDRHMWQRVLFIGLTMGAVTLMTIDLFYPGGLFEGTDSLEVARTAGFTTLVLAQLFNALNARSSSRTAFSQFFSNRWLWAALVVTLLLQIAVVYVPFLQVAFGTASLDLMHWLVAAAMASVVLWAEELSKLIRALISRAGNRS